jgi:glycosyltransferase involved in cell wall biosynthesis
MIMALPRILFVLPQLPRSRVSVRGVRTGQEAVSGSVSSFLLVADALAERGHQIAVLVAPGQELVDGRFDVQYELGKAAAWVADGHVIWCSWGDSHALDSLAEKGLSPWMWLHVHIDRAFLDWLKTGRLAGLIVVSDLTRVSALRHVAHRRVGRVYNPLNPFYATPTVVSTPARYASQRLVFAGYMGETKGAHRMLQIWPKVREKMPRAMLALAGSGQLYGDDRCLGDFGLATPEFESAYLRPIVERFGSLSAAGIEVHGLLTPLELRSLYSRSSLGIVNMNWSEYTETFCCTAVEMLATELPVFSFAAGGLPESIGQSGGAALMTSGDLENSASHMMGLLRDSERLAQMGQRGSCYVRQRYDLNAIVAHWEHILAGTASELEQRTGHWGYRRNLRYWAQRAAGHAGLGGGVDATLDTLRGLRSVRSPAPKDR